jgi:Putative zincin peptidase
MGKKQKENATNMKILAEELTSKNGYKLIETLEHSKLQAFVRANLKMNNWIIIAYVIFHIAIILAIGVKIYNDAKLNNFKWFDDVFTGIGTGFFITFFIAFFIHESIHLLAYKILGAKSSTIKYSKMTFLALADQFVLKRKEFYFLAILPFAVITPILIGLLFIAKGFWFYSIYGILFLHTAGCSGDFALINFFYETRSKEILTFDDLKNKVSYFYQKI